MKREGDCKMSNWCESELTVRSNNVEQLRQFVQHIGDTERGSGICLEKLLPIPEELFDAPADEEGMPVTVEWKINNWGTLCQFAAEASWISDNCIKYVYATKWWPAVEWIKYAALLYPDLEFTLNHDCWEYEYEGTFRAHGSTHSNEMHQIKTEEWTSMPVNAENDGQEGSQIQESNPEKTALPKNGDETVKMDAGNKPVFSFEMVKFD
jgi:hypothetical protein